MVAGLPLPLLFLDNVVWLLLHLVLGGLRGLGLIYKSRRFISPILKMRRLLWGKLWCVTRVSTCVA